MQAVGVGEDQLLLTQSRGIGTPRWDKTRPIGGIRLTRRKERDQSPTEVEGISEG